MNWKQRLNLGIAVIASVVVPFAAYDKNWLAVAIVSLIGITSAYEYYVQAD